MNRKNGDFKSDFTKGIVYTGDEINERRVGLILDIDKRKSVLEYWHLSNRVHLVKLKHFNVIIDYKV